MKERDRKFELKGVLWVGLIIDVIDLLSSLLEVWDGGKFGTAVQGKPITLVGGRAALSVLLLMVGLKCL